MTDRVRERLVYSEGGFEVWELLDAAMMVIRRDGDTLRSYAYGRDNDVSRTFALKLAHGFIAGALWATRKPLKLTDAQLVMLRDAAAGDARKHTRGKRGNATGTVRALTAMGLLSAGQITQAGRDELERRK